MPDDAGYIAWLGNPLIQFTVTSAMSLLLNILPQAALEIIDFFNRFKVNAPFLITGAISKVVTSPGYLQRTILRMGQRFAPGTNIPILSDYIGLFSPSVYAYKDGDPLPKRVGKWFYRTVFLNEDVNSSLPKFFSEGGILFFLQINFSISSILEIEFS